MGQVPEKHSPYVLVGDGRMARHTAAYFRLKNVRFLWWSRQAGLIQDQNGEIGPKTRSLSGSNVPLSGVIPDRAKVLLLVKDGAIESVYDEGKLNSSGAFAIHFSGALTSERITGFHPLCTFGPETYNLEFYERIPFIGEKGSPHFHEVFPELENPFFEIERDQKAFYHALCTIAGNFSQILWQAVFESFESDLKLPKETLTPFLKKTFENLIKHPERALTGPFARGDHETVERHLQALVGHPLSPLYEEFYRYFSANFANEIRTYDENSTGISKS